MSKDATREGPPCHPKASSTPALPAAPRGLEGSGEPACVPPSLGCAHPRTHLCGAELRGCTAGAPKALGRQPELGTSRRREFKEFVMEQRDCVVGKQGKCSRNIPLATRSFFWLKFGCTPASHCPRPATGYQGFRGLGAPVRGTNGSLHLQHWKGELWASS